MTKNKFRLSLLAIFLLIGITSVHSQPGDPGPDPDPSIPFDGGLSLVIAAGVAYAAKKGYDKRKKTTSNEPIEK
jgi:hypothetical protein